MDIVDVADIAQHDYQFCVRISLQERAELDLRSQCHCHQCCRSATLSQAAKVFVMMILMLATVLMSVSGTSIEVFGSLRLSTHVLHEATFDFARRTVAMELVVRNLQVECLQRLISSIETSVGSLRLRFSLDRRHSRGRCHILLVFLSLVLKSGEYSRVHGKFLT